MRERRETWKELSGLADLCNKEEMKAQFRFQLELVCCSMIIIQGFDLKFDKLHGAWELGQAEPGLTDAVGGPRHLGFKAFGWGPDSALASNYTWNKK